MKKITFLVMLLFASLTYAQQIVTTEDGKKLLLKEDGTYQLMEQANSKNSCVIDADFKEPKWITSKIRTRNKTRVGDLKIFVSKDTGVEVDKIILLEADDTHANGTYVLCVDGQKKTYSRGGDVFRKGK